jgi:hypothetical protein
MPMIPSTETQVANSPQKFAMNESKKLVKFIKNDPPENVGKGRKRNPVATAIYNELILSRGQWAHVEIAIPDKKSKQSLVMSLYSRAKKDNLLLESRSLFNDNTKMYDLWVRVVNA